MLSVDTMLAYICTMRRRRSFQLKSHQHNVWPHYCQYICTMRRRRPFQPKSHHHNVWPHLYHPADCLSCVYFAGTSNICLIGILMANLKQCRYLISVHRARDFGLLAFDLRWHGKEFPPPPTRIPTHILPAVAASSIQEMMTQALDEPSLMTRLSYSPLPMSAHHVRIYHVRICRIETMVTASGSKVCKALSHLTYAADDDPHWHDQSASTHTTAAHHSDADHLCTTVTAHLPTWFSHFRPSHCVTPTLVPSTLVPPSAFLP